MKDILKILETIETDPNHTEAAERIRRAVTAESIPPSMDAFHVEQATKDLMPNLIELVTPQSDAEIEAGIMQGYGKLLTDVLPVRDGGQPHEFILDTPVQRDAVRKTFYGIFAECLNPTNLNKLVVNRHDPALTHWGENILRPREIDLIVKSYGLTGIPLKGKDLENHFGVNNQRIFQLKEHAIGKLRIRKHREQLLQFIKS